MKKKQEKTEIHSGRARLKRQRGACRRLYMKMTPELFERVSSAARELEITTSSYVRGAIIDKLTRASVRHRRPRDAEASLGEVLAR